MSKQQTNTDYYSSVLAITFEKWLPKLQDNVFNYNAALTKIKEAGGIGFTKSGDEIIVPLMVSGNGNAKAYAGYDAFDMSPNKGLLDASATIRQYAAPIVISDHEMRINSGKEQVVSIMSSRLMQANGVLKNLVGADLFSDGTNAGGKSILGLKAMCEETATPGAYMNITDSVWVNQYVTKGTSQILGGMSSLDYKTKDGADSTKLILCDDQFAITYEAANQGVSGVSLNYVDNSLADAGFRHISYKGIPMVCDKALSTTYGKAYFLNTDYMGFLFEDPRTTEFVRSGNQLAMSAFLDVACQLITNNRRRQGVLVMTA